MASHLASDLIITGIMIALLIAQFALPRHFRKHGVHNSLANLVLQTLRVVFWLLAALYWLNQAGVHVGTLVTGLGLGGFALGFALKDLLSNIVAGAMILLYHPFNIGDDISVAGQSGKVASISLRYTELVTEGQRILVPNQSIFSNAVVIKE